MLKAIKSFIRDEEGAQVVEYALIIAVVSIGLVVFLMTLKTDGGMTDWIGRVKVCLDGSATCK